MVSFVLRMRVVLALLAAAGTAAAIAQVLALDESRAQTVCTKPQKLGVVFVIDDSGSMSGNDPGVLRGSAVGVGVDQLPDGSVAAVTKFATASSVISGPVPIDTASRAAIKTAVAAGLVASGGTNYVAAFTDAKAQLDLMTDADRKVVVFLSDGAPNSGFDAATQIPALGTPVYTVRFGTADASTLQDIATRSGGEYFDAQSAGDLQSAFGRIVASVTCDQQSTKESFTLAPGVTRTIPFTVNAGDGSFRALASWSTGKVGVRALRPDASAMTPESLLTGETFNFQPTYALLEGLLPQIGGWNLELTADASNAAATNVTIDVFRRALAVKRPVAIQVFCNRSAQKGQAAPCTATVGDAGPPPRQTPTGTVTFTATRGLPATGSCQLQPTPLSPGVASCAVQYTPSDKDGIGVAFPVTMVYEGDGVFGSTTGAHRLISAACVETATSKCLNGVTINLTGAGGTITPTGIPMTLGCAAPAAKSSQTGQPQFGADLCGISVTADASAKDMAKELGASAFAKGNTVAFPGSPSLQTAAHEAVQVVQNRASLNTPSVEPPATGDPATVATPTAVTKMLAGAAATKKKRKVSLRFGSLTTIVAGGTKQKATIKLTKRGKAIRSIYRKLGKKRMPIVFTVRYSLNGSKVTTVRQTVRVRIK